MSLDIIGKLYEITGDPETPTVTELEGWHINTTELLPEIEQFRVEPDHKRRIFAGIDTYCYKFQDEEEAYLHLGDRVKQNTTQEGKE